MNYFPQNKERFLLEASQRTLELETQNLSSNTVAIICHPHPLYQGSMDNKVIYTAAKALQEMGISTIKFNFRGVGKSTGVDFGLKGSREDLLEVYSWLKKVKPEFNLWLAGFSYGSCVAAMLAKELGAEQLISIAPPVSYPEFQLQEVISLDIPWLILQGTEDEVVNANAVYEYASKLGANAKLVKLESATHFFHGMLNDFKNCLLANLTEK